MLETPSRFAPAERASREDVERQAAALKALALLKEVLATVPDLVLVVNPQRQIVFANHALAELVGESQEDLIGQRTGEVMGCVNAFNNSGGCGTTEACKACGIIGSLLSVTDERDDEREARLSLETGGSLDLKVKTSVISVDGERLTVLTLTDIAHEKRRRVLERVFFHDVLNTAGGLQGLAGLIRGAGEDQVKTLSEMMESATAQLVHEIQSQRMLTSVESQDFRITPEAVLVPRLLKEAVGTYLPLGRAGDVGLEVAGSPPNVAIETDRAMFGRVLGNLIKNAIEASARGTVVRVGARLHEGGVEFWVHNTKAIPPRDQLQIFQRSFSTKDPARGLGTYSVKLFTEQYLGGRVHFDSDEDHGTTFRVVLPVTQAQ